MRDAHLLEVRDVAGGAELHLKVVPGASRTQLAGVLGGALKLAVAAPPEAGRANAAVIAFLARLLNVRRSDIAIVRGASQPRKAVRVAGLTAAALRAALAVAAP